MAAAAIEHPWGRLGWIIPSALILWIGLLTIFGLLLERTAPPTPELRPTEIRLVELPPPAGLQGGAAAPAAPAAPKKPAQVIPHPHPAIVRPVPRHPIHHVARPRPVPEIVPSENGTAKSTDETTPLAATAPAAASGTGSATGGTGSAAGGVTGATGSGAGAGAGSDSGGTRAVFAPTPEIPDDMRDEPISTVAVAHFKVDADGHAEVTLTTPTDNPRLNEILLETLKEWRFFPAMRSGVRVPSEIDLRIPVSVE
jgi:protein TonB